MTCIRTAIVLTLMTLGSAIMAADLKLASDVWSPYTDKHGKIRFAVDLVTEALRRGDIRAETTIVPGGTVNKAILGGKFDGTAAMWLTPERTEQFLFSSSFLENRLLPIGLAGQPNEAKTLADLSGKRVGLIKGYGYGIDTKAEGGPVYSWFPSRQDCLKALLSGEIDFFLVDELVLRHVQQRQADILKEHVTIGATPLVRRTLHLALNKKVANGQQILETFDKHIREMVIDGSFNRILHLEWISMDVDGDGTPDHIHHGGMAVKSHPSTSYTVLDPNSPEGKAAAADAKFYQRGFEHRTMKDMSGSTAGTSKGNLKNDEPIELFNWRF